MHDCVFSFAQVVYESLLDTNRMRGLTASDASMSTEIGGKFFMFSGAHAPYCAITRHVDPFWPIMGID
eukprot:6204183-Pleurochrysis_carterae.AAC.4